MGDFQRRVTFDDFEKAVRAEVALCQEQKRRAAAGHYLSRYDELIGREAALEWCLSILEVTMTPAAAPILPPPCCDTCAHFSHSPCLACGVSDADCMAAMNG